MSGRRTVLTRGKKKNQHDQDTGRSGITPSKKEMSEGKTGKWKKGKPSLAENKGYPLRLQHHNKVFTGTRPVHGRIGQGKQYS